MCSIGGIVSLTGKPIENYLRKLEVINSLQAHRGPDGAGTWINENHTVGLAHRRLSIIDIGDTGAQPMRDLKTGNEIVFNGEIFNYIELKQEIGGSFDSTSDTEVILRAYDRWGKDCVNHFNGMFSFAIWDATKKEVFCARDRFGIKPFYYAENEGMFYFASEIKALLPFISEIETDIEGFKDYLTFQFCLAGKTLFKGVHELSPAHAMTIKNGHVSIRRYWQVYYDLDWDHSEKYFEERLEELLCDAIKLRTRSDVPIGGYVSGGIDSSIVSALASDYVGGANYAGFIGKFAEGPKFDESKYAEDVANIHGFELYQKEIKASDFADNIRKVIYHLDQPVAGPGSFNQYMVSGLAAEHRKVVLGGQGGDEIFGGYTRYLIAYFEQCIKGAIDGTMNDGNFIVTYESIIPNLESLRNYKPMLKNFWKEGLFEDLDRRYFRLINRAPDIMSCIRTESLNDYRPFDVFQQLFGSNNVEGGSYFDRMTHFDFKTLLPALLHVEDRMSMAHGLESRVPLLDYRVIELAATIPSNFKLKNGDMKHIFKNTMSKYLPESIKNRKDKMGFPIPLNSWLKNELRDFVGDVFNSEKTKTRSLIDNSSIIQTLDNEGDFSRNIWGLLSLELWQQEFHDKADKYRALIF